MRLKSMLLASAAVAVGLSMAPAAQAGGFYGTLSGGLNWNDDVKATGPTTSVNVQSETGFVVSVALGYHLDEMITPGLRVELEGGYRHNNENGNYTVSGSSGVGNDVTTWSFMGNVWYDFNISSRLRPYIGGGIGWAKNKITPEITVAPEVENENFAWQAGGGINFVVSPHASVGVGYRYMDAGDLGTGPGGGDFGSQTHSSFELNINYDLN
jgi:OOP family OmpA-OmpF porin